MWLKACPNSKLSSDFPCQPYYSQAVSQFVLGMRPTSQKRDMGHPARRGVAAFVERLGTGPPAYRFAGEAELETLE